MTEQQPYELVRRYAHFELRRYPPHAVAEVEVHATFDRAGNAAFRHLFNYISGNNTGSQKVAMTAPVVQGAAPPGDPGPQKVPMTAPVIQRSVPGSGPAGSGERGADSYVVAFVLPSGMSADTAPVPTDRRVRIRSVPGSTAAVVRFSGRGSGSAFARHNESLQEALVAAGLTAVGAPRFARFDPPFKPWFLRRNEVVQDVAPQSPAAGAAA